MTIDEMKNKISMDLGGKYTQLGFEVICKKLTELEKENAELKQQAESDQLALNEATEIIAELKAHCKTVDEVNEKMKCCGNCKHSYSVNTGGCYDTKCELTGLDCINCKDKWELAE